MAKTKKKTSRKGKKEWRANISTEDIGDYFEKTTKDALSGGALDSVPSDSLFFLDKSSDVSVKKKIEKNREKVLRCESLLQRNAFVKPVPSSTLKKCMKTRKTIKLKAESQDGGKDKMMEALEPLDIWNDKGNVDVKAKKKPKPSIIPAVEVEPPGCSFNPSFDAHQDALAQAVADEMQKIYKDELGPQPVPLTVVGEVVDEDEKYFLDADDGNSDDLDEDINNNANDNPIQSRSSKTKRVTRVEFNRRARRKERLKAEAEAKKVESISKEIDGFEPAPLQVLLSEEISGSLRKLKGCCTLSRERFKSLEKRGLIVPGTKRRRR
ncbi:Uncharacterized protein QJS10_CPB20g00163 [Acorus calamus]|uniref:Ribosome biogenesis protein NOP53 n=1 Tax=Acorus calamus TaxID=4465 RepID=A0AAV9CAF5_ACOCL|nr:Uncharacterized protein QJS10_CPB20g00163 [Acorus calamus]